VLHDRGWRDYALLDGRHVHRIGTDVAPPSAFLGVLGMPGLTASVGLLDVAGLREGDVVFVSGAAGAVGSMAGQIAKLRGHAVVGSAGSAEKVAFLHDELGFDAAFDYHDGPIARRLREVGAWLRDGRLTARETIVEGGVEQAPQAFIDLLRGANTGKMLVRIA